MWGVPVDHKIFENVTTAQWLWYYHNYYEDKKERFEHNRDMVEYNASFIEPEAVRKIRDARETAVEVPDKDFLSGIKSVFGRDLPGAVNKGEKEMHEVDVASVIEGYNKTKRVEKINNSTGFNYKDWLSIDLER